MMMFAVASFSQQIYNVRVSSMEDGAFEQMYGAIKVYGDVLNGMKDGAWVETHPNTDLPRYIIHYKEDKKDGLYLEFDKQAYIIRKIDYKNDMIDGCAYSWNRGGKIASRQEYKEGYLDGNSVLYNDKGFKIIGVARESGSTKAMEKAIKQDGYKWPQLVEMDDRANIWALYGCINAAGRRILFDSECKIIAFDPTIEQLTAEVEKRINK